MGIFATCIGYVGMVLSTEFADVILPAIERELAFPVESLDLTLSNMYRNLPSCL